METKSVKMEEVVRLPEVQVRASISKRTVTEYADLIGDGVTFDPVDVFVDGEGRYIMADGWHRFLAREERGLKNIEITIHETASDAIAEAIEFSCQRNSQHGLKL